jgi:hypothetical protein
MTQPVENRMPAVSRIAELREGPAAAHRCDLGYRAGRMRGPAAGTAVVSEAPMSLRLSDSTIRRYPNPPTIVGC